MLHTSLHKVLGDSLSQISTGLCPHIPSSYLSKVWSPINVNGTGHALKRKNLGTPCFLCEILRMSQFTCQGYDLLSMLLMVAGPYPWRMFVLLLPWLQASGPVSQSASSWTAFSSFVSLRYCTHAWLGTLH